MNISIASYSFHGLRAAGMMDGFGYLETVKYRYRLDTADIWNGTLGNDPGVYLQPEYLRSFKEALAEREMTLVNYHVDGVHVWDKDVDIRECNYANALEHLKAAAYLGAKTVRIDAGGSGTEMSEEQFDFTVQRYQDYAGRASDSGFRVGPENHWGPSLNPDVMESLANAVDSPAYGILLHIGHWDVGEERDGDLRMAPWAVHTHIDARVTSTCLEERMRLLLEAGYDGCWGIEHHSAKNEYAEVAYQIAAVQRTLTHLRSESGAGDTINPLLGF